MKSLIIIFCISAFFFLGCSSSSIDVDEEICKTRLTLYPNEVPNDFILNYESLNYDSDNFSFNSKEGRLRKIISWEGAYVDTSMNFTEDERKEVWKMMKDINILRYPSIYEPAADVGTSHEPKYNLTIGYNGITKNIKWTKNTWANTCEETYKLKMLMLTLDSVIIRKKEYQSIQPQGGL